MPDKLQIENSTMKLAAVEQDAVNALTYALQSNLYR
jgi:hypothetical protein